MPNIFGWNTDLAPGVDGRAWLNSVANQVNPVGILGLGARGVGGALDVANPDVDLVKGVGINEARRNVTQTGGTNQGPIAPLVEDPWSQYNGGTANGGAYGGGAYAQTSDPNTAAYYQDMMNQLNGQVGRLDGQFNVGLGNIQNSYNQQSNRLNEQKGIARRNYDTQTQQNTQNYTNTRNSIMSNTRAQANALQRLLGLNGAGNSSAALEQAPYAAGLQGSQNLNQAQQTYSNNRSGLDTNWEDAQRSYNNAFSDLDQQRYSNENNLRSSIAQTRAGLLDKIGQAAQQRETALGRGFAAAQAARNPYQEQVNSLLDQMTNLGNQYANPVMKTGDVTFKAPTLNQFSTGNQAQIANQSGGAGNLDPTFVNLLTPRDKDKNSLMGY